MHIYSINNNYFEDIDTNEKAYWLGFIYADGSVNNRGRFMVKLKLEDKGHLQKLLTSLQSNHPIKLEIDKNNYTSCNFQIKNKKLTNDLIKNGVFVNKSLILKPPKLLKNNELIKHFIRGYVDGDGSLFLRRKNSPNLSMVGTEELLTYINNFIKQFIKTNVTLKKHTKSPVFMLNYEGATIVPKIAYLLYENSSLYLDRKYQKYIEIKSMYEEKYATSLQI